MLRARLAQERRSFFLLGPRQTGKSTLIQSLDPELTINLAHEPTFLEFAQNPRLLEERIDRTGPRTIFVDEVQRLPSLLNTIQFLLDQKKNMRFFMSGSSARRLRRGRANLLPGRALSFELGPLSSFEVGKDYDLENALSFGMLPGVFTEESPRAKMDLLRSYASTYLKEEIQAEGLLRRIEGFARFLQASASRSGSLLDFSKLSSQAQVPRQSVVRYFEILEDTLIARRLEVFSENIAVRLAKQPRFYFFDVGVLNGLLKNFTASDDRKGVLFEHFFLQELLQVFHGAGRDEEVFHYRTEGGAEVDFVVAIDGEVFAIEVKASRNVGREDIRHLKAFELAQKKRRRLNLRLAYWGTAPRRIDGVEVSPWQDVLKEIQSRI